MNTFMSTIMLFCPAFEKKGATGSIPSVFCVLCSFLSYFKTMQGKERMVVSNYARSCSVSFLACVKIRNVSVFFIRPKK